MSNLDTNHYLISLILFLLIVVVFMSTKQSMCSIKENFAGRSNVSSENLNIKDGYDTVMNIQNEFVSNANIENNDSDVVSEAINEFNIAASKDIKVEKDVKNEFNDSQYKNDKDFSQSDGAVYSLGKKESVDLNLNKDNIMGLRQSNEDVYGEKEVLEPKYDDDNPEDGIVKDDEGKIIEDPDLGKPNKCKEKNLPEFNPGPFDPFNKYSFSEFDINYAKTKAYRPENIGDTFKEYVKNEDNMSHDENIYDKQKCNIIKGALKEIDNKHFSKTAKEPWDSKFKKPCGKWNE